MASTGINREENLMALGSRNFFLCPKKKAATTVSHGAAAAAGASSKEVAKPSYIGLHGLKLMDILLWSWLQLQSVRFKLLLGVMDIKYDRISSVYTSWTLVISCLQNVFVQRKI